MLVVAGALLIFGAKAILQRPATYEGNGVSLDYPRTWERVTGSLAPPAGINLLWTQGFALDDDNGVGVGAALLDTPVPDVLLESAARQMLEPSIREIVEAAGGTLAGPDATEVAGRKALVYEASNMTLGVAPVDVSLTVLTDGTTAYFIGCQRTEAHAQEVQTGCDMVKSSFTIGG